MWMNSSPIDDDVVERSSRPARRPLTGRDESLSASAVRYRIDELERLLADEFGTLDIIPLTEELRCLTAQRA